MWDLTNTRGSRFRTVFMESRHLPFGHELSEFFDIAREHRPANPWDTGSSSLVLHVRGFDDVVHRLRAFGAPVVTFGGMPVTTASGRSILVRDPDGYLVQVIEASQEDRDAMRGGTVLRAAIRLTVADSDRSLAFYRDLLGFDLAGERLLPADDMMVFGLGAGTARETVTRIPGIGADVILTTFAFPANAGAPVHDYRWRLQDVGSPQFQLQVAGLDDLLAKTREAGYRFLSVGGRPIRRPFGRFVFAVDPDGVLVEFVEPGQP
ncbi:MAG TPA: VOC family protein [Verrucomicrobiae bacterium]|nr:VOC family protein [Verrucomicrobiae bacterium]